MRHRGRIRCRLEIGGAEIGTEVATGHSLGRSGHRQVLGI
jgi:hypothetical protein